MSKFNCPCTCGQGFICSMISVTTSIIIGIISTLLRITGIITLTPAFLWVLFGIAIVFELATLITSSFNRCSSLCSCNTTPVHLLLAGILGTILLSVILLGITFPATSVIGALLSGALLLFFSLIITSSVCIVKSFLGLENMEDLY